ncbi:hypothetical protein ACL02T_34505 [Pseudonocardia sp. RS010]|uniref:hypothetical protein n=1 Tax=Pseudonocardia sp. RS010 TaxID=3385979 RepID=UPI0039A1CD32
MDFARALQVVAVTDDERDEYHDMTLPAVALALAVLAGRLDDDHELTDDEAPAMLALCERLRVFADKHERDLLRHLKYDQGMTWQQIAEAVEGQLGGRQAAQKRWSRLVDPDRRVTTGDYRRGAAEKRAVVDTMPPTAERADG